MADKKAVSPCCNADIALGTENGRFYEVCTECGDKVRELPIGSVVDEAYGPVSEITTVDMIRTVYGTGTKKVEHSLVGRTIVGETELSREELDARGWYDSPLCLVLDDGTVLVPMHDPEGNDGGALEVILKDGRALCMY